MTDNRFKRQHPNLYRAYRAYALLSFSLGLNFLFLNPTFDPLDIPKVVPGAIFAAVGLANLAFLRFKNRHKPVQALMATEIALMFFWCGALTWDFFRLGQTSLQLPLTFLGLGVLGMPLLEEPPENPITEDERVNGQV